MTKDIVKRAFDRALGEAEPDVSRIADAVPEMMAEARRRRAHAEQAGALAVVAPLARRALPRLATAAAILVMAAALVGIRDTSETSSVTTGLDSLMLTGEMDDGSSDILLEAIAQGGRDNG